MLAPITKITTHNILNVDDVFLELLSKSWNIICKKTMTNASAQANDYILTRSIFSTPDIWLGLFRFLCCDCFLLLFVSVLCIMSYFACVSGLSILDCPFPFSQAFIYWGSLFIIISILEHLENVLATYVCLFQDKTWSSNVIPRHTYVMGWFFFVFKWEVVVLFDDIGGIVDHHCLNYLSHKFLGRYVNECLVCDGCQAPCTQINLQQLLFSNCKKKI